MEGEFSKMPVITSGGKQQKVDLEEMLREYLTVHYSTWLSKTCHHSPLISEQNWFQLIDEGMFHLGAPHIAPVTSFRPNSCCCTSLWRTHKTWPRNRYWCLLSTLPTEKTGTLSRTLSGFISIMIGSNWSYLNMKVREMGITGEHQSPAEVEDRILG